MLGWRGERNRLQIKQMKKLLLILLCLPMIGFGQCKSRDCITVYEFIADGGESDETLILFTLYKQEEMGYRKYLRFNNHNNFFDIKYEHLDKESIYKEKKEYNHFNNNIIERDFNFSDSEDLYRFNILFSIYRFNFSMLLRLHEFQNLDFQIMRNGIFARHGYKFRYNGKMYNYFKQQYWYTPKYKDVGSFLTEIEQHNIQLLLQLESDMENTSLQEKVPQEKEKATPEEEMIEEIKPELNEKVSYTVKKKNKKNITENQGYPDGNPDSEILQKAITYEGNEIGEDGIYYRLGKRKILKKTKLIDNIQEEGTVVVRIFVNRLGDVIYAKPGVKGSTTQNKYLLGKARQAALQTKFEKDLNGPKKQIGEIKFQFFLE